MNNNEIGDGQHQHGHELANVAVENKGLRLFALHLKNSPSCFPSTILPDDKVPLMFTLEDDKSFEATLYCGICKKELGKCRVNRLPA